MFGWVFRLFYQLGSMERKPAAPNAEYRWVCPHCYKFEVSSNTASVVERVLAGHMRTEHGKAR